VIVLGIESSCDETAAAIVQDGTVLSNIISSQHFHSDYGGIVPELASRAHLQSIIPIIAQALNDASLMPDQIDLVAATQGPGLIGSLLVGLNAAKAFALRIGKPFRPINHIEAHIFSTFLRFPKPNFPFLSVVISGGHTLLVHVHDFERYDILGTTVDDALGEAYDKVGKLLRLGFPGGPVIDTRAQRGNSHNFSFPKPVIAGPGFDFSFSGIKTSVYYLLRKLQGNELSNRTPLSETVIDDICAGFQSTVILALIEKTMLAAAFLRVRDISFAVGVSANSELRKRMKETAGTGYNVFFPTHDLTTDNAAMVAYLAGARGNVSNTSGYHAAAFARAWKRVRHGA